MFNPIANTLIVVSRQFDNSVTYVTAYIVQLQKLFKHGEKFKRFQITI